MSDYLKSITGWNSDGSLGLHWMERDMANGVLSVNGYANVRSNDRRATVKARYLSLTFPEAGKIILRIGPGDHTCDDWEIDRNQLKHLVRDAMPELLK